MVKPTRAAPDDAAPTLQDARMPGADDAGDAMFASQLKELRDRLHALPDLNEVAEAAELSQDEVQSIKATLDRFLDREGS